MAKPSPSQQQTFGEAYKRVTQLAAAAWGVPQGEPPPESPPLAQLRLAPSCAFTNPNSTKVQQKRAPSAKNGREESSESDGCEVTGERSPKAAMSRHPNGGPGLAGVGKILNFEEHGLLKKKEKKNHDNSVSARSVDANNGNGDGGDHDSKKSANVDTSANVEAAKSAAQTAVLSSHAHAGGGVGINLNANVSISRSNNSSGSSAQSVTRQAGMSVVKKLTFGIQTMFKELEELQQPHVAHARQMQQLDGQHNEEKNSNHFNPADVTQAVNAHVGGSTGSGLHAALSIATNPQQEQQQQQQQKKLQHKVPPSQSSQTKPFPSPHEHRCLTVPGEAVANEGRDNVDGYLIVHTNDMLTVDELTPIDPRSADAASQYEQTFYQVIDVLGQGTFAQVFKCRNVRTNEMVAVKIVKNKPAYMRQAAIEIDIFRVLANDPTFSMSNMVSLRSHFTYSQHLCLVFDLLGLNLYEILKRRQFRGLPLNTVRTLVRQSVESLRELTQRNVVHCDLKPENILVTDDEAVVSIVSAGEHVKASAQDQAAHAGVAGSSEGSDGSHRSFMSGRTSRAATSTPSIQEAQRIKLIDFGSACFEGRTSHTYIQSRFYRSPEVLLGLPYDSGIDMWSVGCVAAELFLGLPILPGVHEHDQLCRITEMIAPMPDWMLEQGTKTKKYFVQLSVPAQAHVHASSTSPPLSTNTKSKWRLKTRDEFAVWVQRNGKSRTIDMKEPNARYFKRKRLDDIVYNTHGHSISGADREGLRMLVHFLKGVLEPDPWKRWTAHQASSHPFITGSYMNSAARGASPTQSIKMNVDVSNWNPPWDPSICRRKLSFVQRIREDQRFRNPVRPLGPSPKGMHDAQAYIDEARDNLLRRGITLSPEFSSALSLNQKTTTVTAMTDAMTLGTKQQHLQQPQQQHYLGASPPSSLLDAQLYQQQQQQQQQQRYMQSAYIGSAPSYHDNFAGGSQSLHTTTQAYHSSNNLPAMQGQGQRQGQWYDQTYASTPANLNTNTNMSGIMYSSNASHGHLAGAPAMDHNPYSTPLHDHSSHNMSMPLAHAQTYSDVYYDHHRQHAHHNAQSHIRRGGDFGYALQRPGVLPVSDLSWHQNCNGTTPSNTTTNNSGVTAALDAHHQQQRGPYWNANTGSAASAAQYQPALSSSSASWMGGATADRRGRSPAPSPPRVGPSSYYGPSHQPHSAMISGLPRRNSIDMSSLHGISYSHGQARDNDDNNIGTHAVDLFTQSQPAATSGGGINLHGELNNSGSGSGTGLLAQQLALAEHSSSYPDRNGIHMNVADINTHHNQQHHHWQQAQAQAPLSPRQLQQHHGSMTMGNMISNANHNIVSSSLGNPMYSAAMPAPFDDPRQYSDGFSHGSYNNQQQARYHMSMQQHGSVPRTMVHGSSSMQLPPDHLHGQQYFDNARNGR